MPLRPSPIRYISILTAASLGGGITEHTHNTHICVIRALIFIVTAQLKSRRRKK